MFRNKVDRLTTFQLFFSQGKQGYFLHVTRRETVPVAMNGDHMSLLFSRRKCYKTPYFHITEIISVFPYNGSFGLRKIRYGNTEKNQKIGEIISFTELQIEILLKYGENIRFTETRRKYPFYGDTNIL